MCRRQLSDPDVIPDDGCSESASTRSCYGCKIHIDVLSWPDHVQSFFHQVKYKIYLTLLSFCWYGNKYRKPHYTKGCNECESRTKAHFFGSDIHPHHNVYTYDVDKDEDYMFIKKIDKHIAENPTREMKEFYCEVCDVQVYNADYFEAHLKGRRHRIKSGEGVTNGAKKSWEGFFSKKKDNNGKNSPQISKGQKRKKVDLPGKESATKGKRVEETSSEEPVPSVRPIVSTQSDSDSFDGVLDFKDGVYTCTICDSTIKQKHNVKPHLKSSRHQKNGRTSGLPGAKNYMKKARCAPRRYAKHVAWFARKILYIETCHSVSISFKSE